MSEVRITIRLGDRVFYTRKIVLLGAKLVVLRKGRACLCLK